MSFGDGRANAPVPVPIGPRNDSALIRVALAAAVVIALGVFGRLLPSPAARTADPQAIESTAAVGPARVRLAAPFRNVVHLRTTEIAVRGVAEPGIDGVDVAVVVGGQVIGEAQLETQGGRFDGLVNVTPPAERTAAVLAVHLPDEVGPPLVEIEFWVEAGSVVLPIGPSGLVATAGEAFLVDVLLYGNAASIRGMLTNDGTMIAQQTVRVGRPLDGAPNPRTIGLGLNIPDARLPARARLHLMALDSSGSEIEHIDCNVLLRNR